MYTTKTFADPVETLRMCGKYIENHAKEIVGDYDKMLTESVHVEISISGDELPTIDVNRKIIPI